MLSNPHFHSFTQWSWLAEATISFSGESASPAINPLWAWTAHVLLLSAGLHNSRDCNKLWTNLLHCNIFATHVEEELTWQANTKAQSLFIFFRGKISQIKFVNIMQHRQHGSIPTVVCKYLSINHYSFSKESLSKQETWKLFYAMHM